MARYCVRCNRPMEEHQQTYKPNPLRGKRNGPAMWSGRRANPRRGRKLQFETLKVCPKR